MHMQRTIRIQLEPSTVQAHQLVETSRQFTAVFNAVCAYGWRQRLFNGVKLHHATYYPLKADYPDLVSDLHIQARVKATEAVKSALALHKAGRKVNQPCADACPPRYNLHTYRVDWESRTVRLSLIGGRQTIRFRIPDYSAKYAGYATDTADLIQRDGRWWLHVVVTVPAPEIAPSKQVVGVDLGLSRPAVTSTGHFLGKRAWKAIEGRVFKLKRALQKRGTKSAKRHLKCVRHTQARFRRDCDHVLSKQIVQSAEPGATLVLENLKDIRTRTKMRRKTETQRRIHSWSFAQLKGFIGYKAEERGCTVVAVDPRHTSQACSRCGHTARNNRRSRDLFVCRNCGFSLHADLNGARNIAAKYRASGGISPTGGLPVNQPLVSDPELQRSG
jgi:putative transposase